MPVFWWVGLDLVVLMGRAVFGGVFWGICVVNMILGRPSTNGLGSVPVLLVVWHGVSSTGVYWPLCGAGS